MCATDHVLSTFLEIYCSQLQGDRFDLPTTHGQSYTMLLSNRQLGQSFFVQIDLLGGVDRGHGYPPRLVSVMLVVWQLSSRALATLRKLEELLAMW
jgi:hypothetical protein